jgi:hypothetical protein
MIVSNNKIFKLTFVVLIMLNLIVILPSLGNLLSIITTHKDILLHYEKYLKKEIVVDSLKFSDLDGSDYEDVSGYSKFLNNYKTEIILGSVKDDNVSEDLGMKENGELKMFLWYREGINIAYPAKKEDIKFPIRNFIYKKIKFSILWLLTTIIIILMYKKIKHENKNKNFNISFNNSKHFFSRKRSTNIFV